jgi:hypothetical protein
MKTITLMICLVIGVSSPVFSLEEQQPSGEECVDTANPSAKNAETPALTGAMTFDFLVSATWPSVIE